MKMTHSAKLFFKAFLLMVAVAQTPSVAASAADMSSEDTLAFVHDPVAAFEDGTYYLFSTGRNIQLLTSHDMRHWSVPSEAIQTVPRWTHDSVPGFDRHVWAPDVIRWHGKWWMAYSCSTFGRNTSAIGLARTSSLAARHWDDTGCLICSHGSDNFNAIDPNFVVDDDDNMWLVFGSFWDGIQLVRLKSVLTPYAEGPDGIGWLHGADERLAVDSTFSRITIARRHELRRDGKHRGGANPIEAPFIFRHDGWYYLFVSWDYCCRGKESTYRVVVGRSRSITGPYLDKNGVDMLAGGGTPVISGDGKRYEAAGHCSVYNFNETDWFFCHGYDLTQGGNSTLIKRRIKWTDGFPVLE